MRTALPVPPPLHLPVPLGAAAWTAGSSSDNPDERPAISAGYRGRLGRTPDRTGFCGDGIRPAAGAGKLSGCRRSGQGGTWRVRRIDGRSGNNGKDAARRESSETGLRIDLLRKPDCCAALQPLLKQSQDIETPIESFTASSPMELPAPAAPPPGTLGIALIRRKWLRFSPPLTIVISAVVESLRLCNEQSFDLFNRLGMRSCVPTMRSNVRRMRRQRLETPRPRNGSARLRQPPNTASWAFTGRLPRPTLRFRETSAASGRSDRMHPDWRTLVGDKQTVTVSYDQYAKASFWSNGIQLKGGATSYVPSQGYDAQGFIDPTRTRGAVYDPDAIAQGLPQANTGEEFGHEILGHIWGELNGGHPAGTQANMRDSIAAEDAVRKLDPARGQKAIDSHHNYSGAIPDKK